MPDQILPPSFFQRPALCLAASLLGKILWHRRNGQLLGCRIIETEGYTLADKASHAYRGRKGSEAMLAPAGTIYMYRIRQWDSLNISALGLGCAVLIKAAVFADKTADRRLSGQGLLCQTMHLRTAEWNGKHFGPNLYLTPSQESPKQILVTPRLGVIANHDWPYRFVEYKYAAYATLPHIKVAWRRHRLARVCANIPQAVHFAAVHSKFAS